MTLEGKVAVVTGAGGGIGHAASVALARAGASLVLVRLDEARLERPRDAVTEFGGAARHVVADVSRSKDCARYVELAGSAFGRLDVLFNNAGIEGAAAPLAAYPEEEFDRVIATNLRGVFLGLRHALPRMIEQGEGSIVNSSSIAGKLGLPYTGAYNAAKHAVIGLTTTAAAEVGPSGVRVNAICPGPTDTAMLRRLGEAISPDDPDAALDGLAQWSPLRRLATPEEIAEVVVFLASPDAGFVNGVALSVDGGSVITR